MVEDPLNLKQKVGMMLREQLWSITWGTLFRMWYVDAQDCSSGAQLPGENVVIGTSSAAQLLLSYYSLGQPGLRQNNGSALLHKIIVSSLTDMS